LGSVWKNIASGQVMAETKTVCPANAALVGEELDATAARIAVAKAQEALIMP
jgi:hypothetical protein